MNEVAITFLSLILLCSSVHAETYTETSAPNKIGPSTPATLYNGGGIQIGNELFIYMQGGDGQQGVSDPDCLDYGGDHVIAYKAPIVNGDIGGPFERVGRVTPFLRSPTRDPDLWPEECEHPPAAYGPGQIFQATVGGETKYHWIVDVSDVLIFNTVWRAESTDGVNWTWYVSGPNTSGTETLTRSDTGASYDLDYIHQEEPFLRTDEGRSFALLNAVVVSTESPLVNNAEWWGYLNFFKSGMAGTAATVIKVDWSTGSPVVSRITHSSVKTPNWEFVELPNGNFVESPLPVVARKMLAKSLTYRPSTDTYELWGHANIGTCGFDVTCNTENVLTWNGTDPFTTVDGTNLQPGDSGRPFWLMVSPQGDIADCSSDAFERSAIVWYPTTKESIGLRQLLHTDYRHNPSGYRTGMNYGFRWESPGGDDYIFTGTNDDNVCDKWLFAHFADMYTTYSRIRGTSGGCAFDNSLLVSGQMVTEAAEYVACNSIDVDNFTADSEDLVLMKAGASVSFGSGSVLGGRFAVEIDTTLLTK